MSEPFLGEIKLVPYKFAPRNYAFCNGQLLPIAQNQALFALLGTTYGGNGVTTFALPDLQGRIPIHNNGSYPIGSVGGEASHTLSLPEIPLHNHGTTASSNAPDKPGPAGNFLATGNASSPYATSANNALANQTIAPAGGGQPHENMPPFLVVNFVIALAGIFPSRN